MAHDKNDWMEADTERERLIRELVETTDVSPLQAKELVATHGADRERLLEAARSMKAEG